MLQSFLDIDLAIFRQFQGMIPSSWGSFLVFSGESIVFWCMIVLISLWFQGIKRGDNRYKIDSMMIFTTIIFTFILYTIINLGLPQWRPGAMEISGARAIIPHPTDNSFPSGHALFTGAFLVGLWYFARRPWLIGLTVLLGLITALSRIFGGVHYPGDILGGWLFGWIGGVLFAKCVTHAFFREKIFAPIVNLAHFFKL